MTSYARPTLAPLPRRHPAKNVIAAPAANAANQEYALRRGDSLSPRKGDWLVAATKPGKV
jgi:hypothetical protein